MSQERALYDAIIVGAGISGSFMAYRLSAAGMKCLVVEAGKSFSRHSYPRKEIDANSQLYWAGGIELNSDCTIGFLRPKAVGGGSIVNQALVDRFDDIALDSWREVSGVAFFTVEAMAPWYEMAEGELSIQYIPKEYWNKNAEIFRRGFDNNGYQWAPLRRAQRDCRYQDGNDCIECLAGCRIDSKQSMPVTVLKKALAAGAELVSECEVVEVLEANGQTTVRGIHSGGREALFRSKILVLAAGAIGNVKLLLSSGFERVLPALGKGFYTHPQYMNLALYDEPINAHKGPFQSLKSADMNFRKSGFKLENVYAPPVGLAMLIPGFGKAHQRTMKSISHLACIEVAVRDTNPGRIRVGRAGRLLIDKRLNAEDRARRERGLAAVRNIFLSTGAKKIIEGDIGIGLHLMGGCNMGCDPARSVVSPEFRLHGYRNVFAADSSVFPNAPGINPSLTVMALSLMGAEQVLKAARS